MTAGTPSFSVFHMYGGHPINFAAVADSGPATLGAGSRDLRPVVICGFGELGQSVVNMLESPLSQTLERGQVPYVAFDLQPARIKAARAAGFNVLYGYMLSLDQHCVK